jgi:hypothetical protein
LFPFTHRCYKPNLVEIGSAVPEKLKMFKSLRTPDDVRKRIAIGHLSDSGDLKRYESILGDGVDKRRAVRMKDGDRQKPDNKISRTLQTILTRLEQLEQGPYQGKGQPSESGQSKNRCYGCGSPDNFIRQCPARNANSTCHGGADIQTKNKSGNSYLPFH